MNSNPPRDAPVAASSDVNSLHRTQRLSPWQLALARLNLPLSLLLMLFLGVALGIGVVLGIQYVHGTVATVNGVPIRDHDFYHRLEVAAGPQVLQQMVNEDLQIQFAAKQGVAPTDAQVEAKLDEARREPNFAQTLKSSRQTEDDLRHSLRASLSQAAVLTKGVTVTDADVQAFYAHNVDPANPTARYYTPEAVQVAVIVTPTPQASAQVVGELAAGMPFTQAAAKYSKDPSAANGGLLPPILQGRSAVTKNPAMEKMLFGLRVGQQINSVKIGTNYWIIRCVGRAPATTQRFAAVQDEARQGALLTKGIPVNGPAMQQAYTAFRQSSAIIPIWSQYKPANK